MNTLKRKKYLFLTGAVVILLALTAALFLSIRDQSEPGKKPQTTTQQKEGKDESTTQTGSERTREAGMEDCLKVYGTDHLYYLDPEGCRTFQKRLTHFVRDHGIDAESAKVLEYCIDDREKANELAQFFLRLDDRAGSIVRVSFEKTTGTYRFNICHDPLSDEETIEGATEYEIPESTDDDPVPESSLSITDPEGVLEKEVDMKELKSNLQTFLRSEEEGRRNLYVRSVTLNREGYKALLCFETVRQDGRNVEVTYDGEYHFHFV